MNKRIISKILAGTLLCSMFAYVTPVFAYTKDEMVYSKAGSDGKIYRTVVSEHLKNTDKEQVINDLSDLLSIENTKGDETFLQNGMKIKWQADGNDIYYQGETSKETPINTEIKYELNGRVVSPDEIKGKSGNVKITIKYTNNEKRNVLVNGNYVDMYVPFVVVCGTIIDNEKNSNVEVTNGKAINDGSKTMVMGLAAPGLQESLGISAGDIDIPSSVEITMNTTSFEQKNIITFATPKVFEENDLKVFDKMDEIFAQVNKLESASNQLADGGNTLKNGARTFAGKSQEFNQAMAKYAEGISNANSSYNKINNGIEELNSSAGELEEGAALVSGGVTQLSTQLNSALTELSTQQAVLQTKAGALGTATTNLYAQSEVIVGTLQNSGVDADTIALITNQLQASQDLLQTLQNSADISSLSGTLASGISDLQTGANSLYVGMQELTEGTAKLANGSEQMKAGMDTLDDSANQLLLANGQLTLAAETIANGSEQLANGITKFDNEGIKKITNVINGKGKDTLERIKKLKDLAQEYNSFTMVEEGNVSSVQFITVVDSIKDEEN